MTQDSAPDRIASLDLLRGVAVLGILLLNIVGFAMPDAAYFNPRAYGGWHGADLAVWLGNFVLFDGKMRGLFSFLFGASMLLIADRAEAAGRHPASIHYRRMAWLLLFGLAHLWLVWAGDILAHYALVGMLAFALRGMASARLVVLGAMLVLLSTLLFAAFPLQVLEGRPEALRELTDLFGVSPAGRLASEIALYRSDYAMILAARFREDQALPLRMLSLVGPETLAYMCFGMAALRSGMLTGAWSRARYRRWLALSWGVGLPAYAALAAMMIGSGFSLLSVAAADAIATLFRPAMIAGWIAAVLLMLSPAGTLGMRLAAAGRMALSNYLLTSLICTTLFYGYGLGWFGRLSRWQLYPVVLVLWAAMLLWSQPWLARFRFGPFEWMWRSLARGAPQPLVRTRRNTLANRSQ